MIRVMIVEDEPHAQRRLRRMIERLDDFFRIDATALDGEEALDILKTTRCDALKRRKLPPLIVCSQWEKKDANAGTY